MVTGAMGTVRDYEGIAASAVSPIPWTDRRAGLPAALNEEVFTATITP
jgi:hypothetical protein